MRNVHEMYRKRVIGNRGDIVDCPEADECQIAATTLMCCFKYGKSVLNTQDRHIIVKICNILTETGKRLKLDEVEKGFRMRFCVSVKVEFYEKLVRDSEKGKKWKWVYEETDAGDWMNAFIDYDFTVITEDIPNIVEDLKKSVADIFPDNTNDECYIIPKYMCTGVFDENSCYIPELSGFNAGDIIEYMNQQDIDNVSINWWYNSEK